jgi:RHS repeat-associated protein
LTVEGSLIVDGVLSADGGDGTTRVNGGGSGGSILLTAAVLAGGGQISADGGACPPVGGAPAAGGGGGGRIAIYCTTDSFTGTMSARGGSGYEYGGAGTIYRKSASQAYGDLLVDNGGNAGATSPLPTGTYAFDNVDVRNKGVLEIPSDVVLTMAGQVLTVQNEGELAIAGEVIGGGGSGFTAVVADTGGDLTLKGTTQLICSTIHVSGQGTLAIADSAQLVCTEIEVADGTLTVGGTGGLAADSVEILSGGTFVMNTADTYGSLHVASGGVVTHTANGTAQEYWMDLTITGDVTVDVGGAINVDGKGYVGAASGNEAGGPGGGESTSVCGSNYGGSGAGYGGKGGDAYAGYTTGGMTYGSVVAPTDLGSGGGRNRCVNSTGGSGGGAVRVMVAGNLVNNGTISARGAGGSGYYYGSGAGGSLYVTTGTLSGSGVFAAGGGTCPFPGGGGGGGRIAIYYTTDSFAGTISARGGSGSEYGGAGTIYRKSASQAYGDLLVENGGNLGATTPIPYGECTYDWMAVANRARVWVPATVLRVETPSAPAQPGEFIAGELTIDHATLTGSDDSSLTLLEVTSGGILTIQAEGVVACDHVDLLADGVFYLDRPYTFPSMYIAAGGLLTTHITGIDLSVTGALVIDADGVVSVDGRGYAHDQGPGAGAAPDGGGGHGGEGGQGTTAAGGAAYGSLTAPDTAGSGGGGAGGGSGGGTILLTAETLSLDGLLTADGADGDPAQGGGGGAGGSIRMTVPVLTGSGMLRANGGAGALRGGGGGAGGRIAVAPVDAFLGTFSACGGTGQQAGGAGTIIQKTAAQTYGDLLVNNCGLIGAWTPIAQEQFDNVVIADGATLTSVAGSQSVLEVLGNLSIEIDGAISVNGRGYGPGAGPGFGRSSETHGGGGALAGAGGSAVNGTLGGPPVGHASIRPNRVGSGGGSATLEGALGGAGGGAIRLDVGGVLSIDGVLLANGEDGQTVGSGFGGGGAGGAIAISSNVLTGGGVLCADGGAGAGGQAGGGGGGQIAVLCDQDLFAGLLSACGGTGAEIGGAGAIYWNTNPSAPGDLLVDNWGQFGERTGFDHGSLTVGNADVVNGAALLELRGTAELTVVDLLNCVAMNILGGELTLIGTCPGIDLYVDDGSVDIHTTGELTCTSLELASYSSCSVGGRLLLPTATLLVDQSDLEVLPGGELDCGPAEVTSGSSFTVGGMAGTGNLLVSASDLFIGTQPDDGNPAPQGTETDARLDGVLACGNVQVSGGTLSVGSPGQMDANNLTFTTGSVWTLLGTVTCGAIATQSSSWNFGSEAELHGTSLHAVSMPEIAVRGLADLSGTVLLEGSHLTVESGAQMNGDPLTLAAGGTCTLEGLGQYGDISVPAGCTLSVTPEGEVIGSALSLGGHLVLDHLATFQEAEVSSGGVLTHSPEIAGFDLLVFGDMLVASGATVTAAGKGFGPSAGPGAGQDHAIHASGAGHAGPGGFGGWYDPPAQVDGGPAYGSVTAPSDLGSGGGNATDGGEDALGGAGGGALYIVVNGTLTVNGVVSANGLPGGSVPTSYYAGGGSGGSIFIQAGHLAGAGVIKANGADGDGYQFPDQDNGFGSGGGSAGRLALYVGDFTFSGVLSAQGGDGFGGGAGGTIVPFTDPPANNPAIGGDPVMLHSGEFYYTQPDIFIPARGLPIEITRTYRSLLPGNTGFGHGWDFSFNQHVAELADGAAVLATGAKTQVMYPFQDGAYRTPLGRYDTLVKHPDGTWTQTDKHQTRREYDSAGRLVAIVDRNGNALTYGYTADQLTTITDATGRAVTLSYADTLLTAITDWAGRTWTYTYDPATEDLLAVTAPPTPDFPAGTTTTYTYDARHHLTSVTDPKGQAHLINTYDDLGRVLVQVDADNTLTFTYDWENQVTTSTDSRGVVRTTRFNSVGNPIEMSVSDGDPQNPTLFTTLAEYNAEMEQTRLVHPRGNEEVIVYDDTGNLLTHTRMAAPGFSDPDLVTAYSYDDLFNFVETVTDPRGYVTTCTYDPETGDLLAITQPSVGGQTPVWTFSYNAHGQMETETDPEGLVTLHEYDPATGYRIRDTRNAGGPPEERAVTEFTYDDVGDITAWIDANGHTTAYSYNDQSQLTQTVNALGYVTLFTYDANGNIASVDRQDDDAPDGWQTTTFTHNLRNQVESVTDDMGHTTTYSYDPAGNLTALEDAEQNVTTFQYDERDLRTKTIDALTHEILRGYDDNGNLASLTDQNGNTTAFACDGFDRLQTTIYPDTSAEIRAYDAAGNLTSFTNRRGQPITYAYDALNRRQTKTTPDYGTATFTYDRVGRLLTVTDLNGMLSHGYDDLGRLAQATDTFNKVVLYEYDLAGNRTRLTYPDGTWLAYEYDPLNRPVTIRDPALPALADLDTDQDVDADDFAYLVAGLNGPGQPPAAGYERADLDGDGDADLHDAGLFQTAFGEAGPGAMACYRYDSLARRVELRYANGTTATYTYDDANRLLELAHAGPAITWTYAYTYDNVGNRLTMTVNGTDVHAYAYDDIYRLTDVDYPSPPGVAYNYDATGNRITVVADVTTTYDVNNLNQYTAVDGVPYAYDGSGNLTSDGVNTYAYDAENRLVSATTPTDTVTYTYDALGRRIAKTSGAGTTRYVYCNRQQVLAEYDGDDQLLARYVLGYRMDEPLRRDVPDVPGGSTFTSYYYHLDALGSVIALTDAVGTVVDAYLYDVFGAPAALSSVGNPYFFTGRRYDAETDLYHYRARAYAPVLGRFLQADPSGYSDDVNLYTYVRNNPANYTDPMGRERSSGRWRTFAIAPDCVDDPWFCVPPPPPTSDLTVATSLTVERGEDAGRPPCGAATGLEAAPLLLWMAWLERRGRKAARRRP